MRWVDLKVSGRESFSGGERMGKVLTMPDSEETLPGVRRIGGGDIGRRAINICLIKPLDKPAVV
jgi:hypothetical protein